MEDENLNIEATSAADTTSIVDDMQVMTQDDLRKEVEDRVVDCCSKILFGVPTDEEATRSFFGHYPPTVFETMAMISGGKSARNYLSDREIRRNRF